MPRLYIISIQEEYLVMITKQIREVFGDWLQLSPMTIKDLQKNTIEQGNVVLLSNQLKHLPRGMHCFMLVKKSFDYKYNGEYTTDCKCERKTYRRC